MVIDISEIISTDHKSCEYRVDLDMAALEYEGLTYPFADKEPVDITAANIGSSRVVLSGKVDVTLFIPCSRCLKDVSVPLKFDFSQEIDFGKVHAGTVEDLDEIAFIDGNTLDVDRFVRNELIVHLPVKVLCRKDCKGLCPVCGKDLNEGDCGCSRQSVDPRMAAIRDIFKDFKEV